MLFRLDESSFGVDDAPSVGLLTLMLLLLLLPPRSPFLTPNTPIRIIAVRSTTVATTFIDRFLLEPLFVLLIEGDGVLVMVGTDLLTG